MQDLRLRFWLRFRLAIIPQVPSHTNHINNAAVLPKANAPEVPSEKNPSNSTCFAYSYNQAALSKMRILKGWARKVWRQTVLHVHGNYWHHSKSAVIGAFCANDVGLASVSQLSS